MVQSEIATTDAHTAGSLPAPGHTRKVSQGTGRSPLRTRLPAALVRSEGFFCRATCMQDLNFPDQGLTPHALRWKHGILTTGSAGTSLAHIS